MPKQHDLNSTTLLMHMTTQFWEWFIFCWQDKKAQQSLLQNIVTQNIPPPKLDISLHPDWDLEQALKHGLMGNYLMSIISGFRNTVYGQLHDINYLWFQKHWRTRWSIYFLHLESDTASLFIWALIYWQLPNKPLGIAGVVTPFLFVFIFLCDSRQHCGTLNKCLITSYMLTYTSCFKWTFILILTV